MALFEIIGEALIAFIQIFFRFNQKSKGANFKKVNHLLFIALVILVAFISIVIFISIPNKEKETLTEMESILEAAQLHYEHYNKIPRAKTLAKGKANRKDWLYDEWENPYIFDESIKSLQIKSIGKDQISDTKDDLVKSIDFIEKP